MEELSYAKAGIDLDVTDAAKREMARSVDSGDPRVYNRLGAFASLLEGRFPGYEHPVLVMKTEEPGSKQKLAFELGMHASIARDLVNHLVNDLMVAGAEPLYVQDCIVCGKIQPEVATGLVASMAEACREQGCVLCGGETSVQPGVLPDGLYILSASAVGVVERERILDGSSTTEGDVVLAVASNGLHTNGYTLVRKLLEGDPRLREKRIGRESFIDVVMRPHTCYYRAARGVFKDAGVRGMAHITGGGLQDNVNRILPRHLDAVLDLNALQIPEVFGLIRREGSVPDAEMLRTFNMGAGLTLVCAGGAADRISAHFKGFDLPCYPLGKIIKGSGRVGFSGLLRW